MASHKLFLLLISIFFCGICYAQPVKFSIQGRLSNESNSKKVFLQGEINEEVDLTDSREFSYTGSLSNPGHLFIKTDNSYAWALWIDEGKIDVTIEEYGLDGSDSTDKKLLKITSIKGPEDTEKRQWFADYQNSLFERFKELPKDEITDAVAKELFPAVEEYVAKHPGSKFSPYLIKSSRFDTARQNRLLALLNSDTDAEEVKRIKQNEQRNNLLKPGNPIANFSQSTINGKMFSLKSISNRYILLEFWSSDCPPCRRDNPKLVEIYNQFKDKGFEVVGISLDRSKDAWVKAVKKDKLPWINVSDLQGWNNALAVKYQVGAIPFNILVDKNYNVIKTNLSPQILSDQLAELHW